MKKDIDFSKMASEFELDCINDKIKGVIALLQSLSSADDIGTHKYQTNSYEALAIILNTCLDDMGKLKDGIDYMDNQIRETISK